MNNTEHENENMIKLGMPSAPVTDAESNAEDTETYDEARDAEGTELTDEDTDTDEDASEADSSEADSSEADSSEADSSDAENEEPKVLSTNDILIEYYRLKHLWEIQLKEKKKNKNKKLVCVNCKRVGGTNFSIKNGILKATCNSENPCNLNIEIKRGGKIVQLRDLEMDLNKKINQFKSKMITLKLDLLFGYQDEEKTIELFKENNKLLTEHEKLLYECHNYTISMTTDREKEEKEYTETLKNEIEEIKFLTSEYEQSKEPKMIEEIVKKYVDTVYPLLENIRNTKYHHNAVECEDVHENDCVINRFVQNEFKVEETEMYIGDEMKVISYTR